MTILSIYRQWAAKRALRKLIREHEITSFLSQIREVLVHGILDSDKISVFVEEAMAMAGIRGREDIWRAFFDSMPSEIQPTSFEVHHLMNRIDAAAEAAETENEKRAVMKLCESTRVYSFIEIGLELARQLKDSDSILRLHEQAGDAVAKDQPRGRC